MKHQKNNTQYMKRLQSGIDYIENNLESSIDIQVVASEAAMSRWHFQRMFRAMTGDTVKCYIRSRRLSNALEALLGTDRAIIDIALSAGFETQESFTRAFTKNFDITPGKFRELGDTHKFMRRLRFDDEYLHHIQTQVSREPTLDVLAGSHYIGMQTEYYGIDSDKNNLGNKLEVLWDQFLERVDDIDCEQKNIGYGIIQQAGENSERLKYLAAFETSPSAPIPEKMVSYTSPEARYAIFEHMGDPAKLDNTVNYIYATWLPQSDYLHTEKPDIEIYGADYIPDDDRSLMHYAIPISKQ